VKVIGCPGANPAIFEMANSRAALFCSADLWPADQSFSEGIIGVGRSIKRA
jgi:hypothetical protein